MTRLIELHGCLADDLAQLTLAQADALIRGDCQSSIPFLVWLLENPHSSLALPGKIYLREHDYLHLLLEEPMNEYDILRYEIWEQYNTDKILYVNPLHNQSIAVLFQGDWEKACELEGVRDRVHQKLLDRRISSELIIDRLELDAALRESKKNPAFYEDVVAHTKLSANSKI